MLHIIQYVLCSIQYINTFNDLMSFTALSSCDTKSASHLLGEPSLGAQHHLLASLGTTAKRHVTADEARNRQPPGGDRRTTELVQYCEDTV